MIKTEAIFKWQSTTLGKVSLFLWAWILPFLILYLVFDDLLQNEKRLMDLKIVSGGLKWVVLLLVLLPLNVFLEAFKWSWLVRRIQAISLFKSVEIILAGKSLDILLPLGLGSNASKFLATHLIAKQKTMAALALGNFAQFVPAFLIGLIPLYYVLEQNNNPTVWVGLASFAAIGLVLFCVLRHVLKRKWDEFFLALSEYGVSGYLKVLSVSLIRYLVFTTQFVCVFLFLGINLEMNIILLGVAWIFFVKTVIPNASLIGDLMKREVSALMFFQFYMDDIQLVLLANVIVWLVNIVFPALAGILFVSSLKESIK